MHLPKPAKLMKLTNGLAEGINNLLKTILKLHMHILTLIDLEKEAY